MVCTFFSAVFLPESGIARSFHSVVIWGGPRTRRHRVAVAHVSGHVRTGSRTSPAILASAHYCVPAKSCRSLATIGPGRGQGKPARATWEDVHHQRVHKGRAGSWIDPAGRRVSLAAR